MPRRIGPATKCTGPIRTTYPGLGLKAVWYGAEQVGNVLGLTKKRQAASTERSRPQQISRSEALASIREDYTVNYFVSGKGDMEAYEPDCLFADPFAGFNGVERFKRNVSNLGGLMQDIQLELTGWEEAGGELRTRWRFSAVLQLPWRPRLAAAGGTTHVFSAESGRVVKHIEAWHVEPGRVVRSLLRPSSRVPTNRWETLFNALDAGDGAGVWLAASPVVAYGAAPIVAASLLCKLATGSGLPGVFLGGLEGLAYLALAAAATTEAFKLVVVNMVSVAGERTVAAPSTTETAKSKIGLIGLAVMGQNLALNVAEKGFPISVYNRTYEKTEAAVSRAAKEGLDKELTGYKELKDFVASLEKPRRVIILVKAGAPVDSTIDGLVQFMEPGDIIIDGGNEWYENTERRAAMVAEKGLLYMGMGVSGGEEGARNGPSMMPGGTQEAYTHIKDIVEKVAAQVNDGPCVTFIGPGGAGNFVKMVHNGIEYGDMQLISEAYDVLKTLGGLTNEELNAAFNAWNKGELDSFLIEISALILAKKDEDGKTFMVDKILDKTGMKGTGKWTVQQAAELSVAAPTIEAALDGRFLSGLKEERVAASEVFAGLGAQAPAAVAGEDKEELVKAVAQALYASKICSYAQGMNIIRAKSVEKKWGIEMGSLARIWKGGCIIRAQFLDEIREAYMKNPDLKNLLVDPNFAKKLVERQAAWRKVVALAISNGVAVPGMTASLGYFDTYRRAVVPANLVQAQRDFFGSHTYERTDRPSGEWFHTVWDPRNSADSITTSGYNN
ncbi:hypothetical protein WJX81_001436 [Elliptochloris bilobata]|uniref:6-phosphogluconate dehydrogenase, decarboxylating n=1 Tax=Elliptochloris bilobata TaxID=381761 RepID=A0AAW1SJN5_9CHLO